MKRNVEYNYDHLPVWLEHIDFYFESKKKYAQFYIKCFEF